MTQRYEKTSHYWNDIYEKMETYNPKNILASEELESALNWVSQNGGTLMDFGSGNGEMLLRGLEKGAIKTIGVDLSFHAISLARRTAAGHYENLRTKWVWGDVKSLHPLPDACIEGLILSNILDCIHPEDGMTLLRAAERLLDRKGRLLLKMNLFLEDDSLNAQNLKPVTSDDGECIENAYIDPKGLFVWNLTDSQIETLFEDQFDLVESSVIELEKGVQNRLFLFQLKA